MVELLSIPPYRVDCSHIVMPSDTNALGNAFGGQILSWMDVCAGIAAYKHSKRPSVTVYMDSVHFKEAIHLGDVVRVSAQVDFTGRTSMEVSVSVDVDDIRNDKHKHCLDGFFTFVALDDNGVPTEVPKVSPLTAANWVKYKAAEERYNNRKGKKR